MSWEGHRRVVHGKSIGSQPGVGFLHLVLPKSSETNLSEQWIWKSKHQQHWNRVGWIPVNQPR